ncbi:MAG: UDP-N-acetylglucosamine 1-carboxyvinyltransferase [Alphaproteobacteria bacterium]|nr:UDP-N-acetylglucosamine 1-carboxyvinyltransferase [Alphaproteobacteria bacterium]
MQKIHIHGRQELKGKLLISGSKNAALPIMAACLLTDEPLILNNLPDLADINTMIALLEELGTHTQLNHPKEKFSAHRTITLKAHNINNTTASYDIVRKMRASILVLGPLLSRFGHAQVSLPGGCAIGARPVDLHLNALETLGAKITLHEGYVHAAAPQGLTGAKIIFPMISVGATENLLMAACLAKGETLLENAAREPEIVDLALCLKKMGALIEGIGTNTLKIIGVEKLHGATHNIIPDRIEIGTYAMAAAITNSTLELIGTGDLDMISSVVEILNKAGVVLEKTQEGIKVYRQDKDIKGIDIMTEPFPGFPTDLQAQIMALLCIADGSSLITETIFENRFMHVPELTRMGANIHIQGKSAHVRGVKQLTGAEVMATDLRGSVSLVLAGLAAEGETILNHIYHLDRGYEHLDLKLKQCGAHIERY